MKILYVCYSNKGRSVALAAYTNHFFKRRNIEGIAAESAGIGIENIESLRKRKIDSASHNTAHLLKEEGIDISDHKIKYVGEVISGSNLILATDEMTLVRTLVEFPDYRENCFLAKRYAGFVSLTELFGPYAESRKLRHPEWTELDLYRDMLREVKIVSEKVAERLISDIKA